MQKVDRFMDDNVSAAVAVDGVSRCFATGEVLAVNDVTLSIKPGEFVAIVGSSGSGKSTLLNLIGGIELPDTGVVRIFSQQPASSREWARLRARTIGMVFQSFHLIETLTALENVMIPLFGQVASSQDRRQRGLDLLARVGLSHRCGHRPGQLSGGERQRVAIARSLVNNPSILLADEPTGNLDSQTAGEIIDLFREVHRQDSVTLILVTHESEIAARADRVVRLHDGCIVETNGGD